MYVISAKFHTIVGQTQKGTFVFPEIMKVAHSLFRGQLWAFWAKLPPAAKTSRNLTSCVPGNRTKVRPSPEFVKLCGSGIHF